MKNKRTPQPPNLKPPAAQPGPPSAVRSPVFEAEIIPSLEEFARAELTARLGKRVQWLPAARDDVLRLGYGGEWAPLLRLRSVVAVFVCRTFPVPRPRALLGHQHFTTLLRLIEQVRGLHPPGTFHTLRISAAGEESSVLNRLREELETQTGLAPTTTAEEADLLLRLRRAPGPEAGWEVLARLTPRPLTARAWRVCNMPGALNAVIAHATAQLSAPAPTDRYLNLACGSGTLLIERLALGPAALALGVDHDPAALACARENLTAARLERRVRLVRGDMRALPLPDRSVDVLTSDLPFGQMIGSHAENEQLYPTLLREATRVAAAGARLVLITHEIRLLERLLAVSDMQAAWTTEQILRVKLPFKSGGLNPRVYLLRRVGE
jgi:ubiquinone/menaquinone biosynthesis C-methylase UbiE